MGQHVLAFVYKDIICTKIIQGEAEKLGGSSPQSPIGVYTLAWVLICKAWHLLTLLTDTTVSSCIIYRQTNSYS